VLIRQIKSTSKATLGKKVKERSLSLLGSPKILQTSIRACRSLIQFQISPRTFNVNARAHSSNLETLCENAASEGKSSRCSNGRLQQ
jgi:hypothetical protein